MYKVVVRFADFISFILNITETKIEPRHVISNNVAF